MLPKIRTGGLIRKDTVNGLVWQTNNGCEFQENKEERGLPSTVRALGSDHRFIPPKRYTWQRDVETVHRLVEDEFLDLEQFRDREDFFAKVSTYWSYSNLLRLNRAKTLFEKSLL